MCDSEKEASNSDKEKKDDENNVVMTNEQLSLMEDQRQELADLRRQVVFLQVSCNTTPSRAFNLLLFFCFTAIRKEAPKGKSNILRNRFSLVLPRKFCFQTNWKSNLILGFPFRFFFFLFDEMWKCVQMDLIEQSKC